MCVCVWTGGGIQDNINLWKCTLKQLFRGYFDNIYQNLKGISFKSAFPLIGIYPHSIKSLIKSLFYHTPYI